MVIPGGYALSCLYGWAKLSSSTLAPRFCSLAVFRKLCPFNSWISKTFIHHGQPLRIPESWNHVVDHQISREYQGLGMKHRLHENNEDDMIT